MNVYLDLVILLNFSVDFLLLIGTNRLSGYPAGMPRSALSAGLGAVYAGWCMLPGFHFLGGCFWRLVCLCLMALIAFGSNRSTLRRGTVFVLLSMALGGIATGLGSVSFGTLLLAALGVAVLCLLGFRGKTGAEYVPVELQYGGKRICLTALRDTGNTLSDPVTGQQVLVVGADIGWDLLGLTTRQLADPVGTMEQGGIPGLRLIPYRAVGRPSGLLLAVRLEEVKINGAAAGHLVAFAPESFGRTEVYQALAGGII